MNSRSYIKKPPKQKREKGFDWFETTVNGGAVILSVVKEAAQFAPIPYLKQAAGTTLGIIRTVQAVRDNKGDFRRIAEDSAALIAAIFQSYLKSEDRDGWPGVQLEDVLQDLVQTLENIQTFANEQVDRNRLNRLMNSVADVGKIKEYREHLGQAMSRFEIGMKLSAHLQSFEVLRLLKKTIEDNVQSSKQGEAAKKQEREDQELVLQQVLAEKEKDRRKREEEILAKQKELRDVAKLQDDLRLAEERVHQREEAERLKLQLLEDEVERDRKKRVADELALEKLRAKEREYLEERQRLRASSKDHRARVETDSEEEDDDEVEDVSTEEESEDSEEERARLLAEALAAQKAEKKARKKAQREDLLHAELAKLGINPSILQGGPIHPQNSHTPPPAPPPNAGYYPPHHPAYQQPYYHPSPFQSYQPSPYPGSPPLMTMSPAWAGSPPPGYGPTHYTNTNSGNVSNTTISNVGNDFSTNIGSKHKKKSRG